MTHGGGSFVCLELFDVQVLDEVYIAEPPSCKPFDREIRPFLRDRNVPLRETADVVKVRDIWGTARA